MVGQTPGPLVAVGEHYPLGREKLGLNFQDQAVSNRQVSVGYRAVIALSSRERLHQEGMAAKVHG